MNSAPHLAEVDHGVEVTLIKEAVVDTVDVDEDGPERIVARFRDVADLAVDWRRPGVRVP